jgi:hypothetical protein
MTKGRLARFLLAADYMLNVFMGGWYDEWVSTRAWRLRNDSKFWGFMQRGIDRVASAFGQKQHCFWSYVSDQMHRALPPEKRS